MRDGIRVVQNGRTSVYNGQLLGPAVENKNNDGLLYYCFLPELRNIVVQSDHWGRLQPQVMVCLSSKYRLALYELIQKRANLKGKMFEDFSLDQLRKILGMPKGTLLRIQDF